MTNRRRRRRDDKPRSNPVNVALGDDELARLDRLREPLGLSRGAYLASQVDVAAGERLTPEEEASRKALLAAMMDVRAQVARAGVNLNQIAAALNSGSGVQDQQLEAVLAYTAQSLRQCDEATERLVEWRS